MLPLKSTEWSQVTDRHASDVVFAGSVPALYDEYLVPLIFAPFAEDLVARLRDRDITSVLEVAAGSGVVTRAMAAELPATVSVTATDLNQPMIDYAQSVGTSRPVAWQRADVMELPFEDGRRSPGLPGPHAVRLPRRGHHPGRCRSRRVRLTGRFRSARGSEPGSFGRGRRHRLLPGHAAAQRD